MREVILVLLTLCSTTVLAQGERHDPMRPPTQAEIDAWFGKGSQDREQSPFRLQAILLGPQRRIAIIDGQRLRVGERLDGAEVRSIEPGRVVLEREGERIELDIDTHLTNYNDGSRD